MNDDITGNFDYYFKNGPLECPTFKGYYFVPGFTDYCISKDGDLKSIRSGKSIVWSITQPVEIKNITGGYRVTSIYTDFRKRRGVSRHRLLALTFLNPRFFIGNLTVNHLNGIPGDDRLNNLEFCSYSQNTTHAYRTGLYKNKTRKIIALNWMTGEELNFQLIAVAAETLGLTHNLITHRLNKPNNIKYADGWRFKDAGTEWLTLNERVGQTATDVCVVGRCLTSMQVVIFGSYKEASRLTGIHVGAIQSQAYAEPLYPVSGWNFRNMVGFKGWPSYSDFLLGAILRNPNKRSSAIVVYDVFNNTELYFDDCEDAGKYFSISPITVSKLTREDKLYKKKYRFEKIEPQFDCPSGE